MKTIATLLFFALSMPLLFSQSPKPAKIIRLLNPSFEDLPQAGKTPHGWSNCGFPGETPPDIQPEPTFYVTAKPQHGNTYLGMVTRDNDTWEKVGQKLSSPIQANQCYQFSIHLRRSLSYRSRSQLTSAIAEYTTPAKLIIWGGNELCAKVERLVKTKVIEEDFWTMHDFAFKASSNHSYILFEVFYDEPVLFPSNGNILIDNASDLIPVSCDSIKHSFQTIKTISKRSKSGVKKPSAPVPTAKDKGIIYYTSVLTPTEEAATLQEINEYLKTDPPYAAMIYVREKSRKQGKKSKKYLEEKLTAMGWTWEDFTIEIVKMNK